MTAWRLPNSPATRIPVAASQDRDYDALIKNHAPALQFSVTAARPGWHGHVADRGASYGNTLTWTDVDRPKLEVQPVEIQDDLDTEKFYKMFVELLSARTPRKN